MLVMMHGVYLASKKLMTGKLIEVMYACCHAAKRPKFYGEMLTRQKTEQHKPEVAGHTQPQTCLSARSLHCIPNDPTHHNRST